MKAAVTYEYNKPLVVEEVELQRLQAGEVLVRIAASGICGSDLHAITSHLKNILPICLRT